MPAMSICGFFDKSNRFRYIFSVNASAIAMVAAESRSVSDKFKLSKQPFLAIASFKFRI